MFPNTSSKTMLLGFLKQGTRLYQTGMREQLGMKSEIQLIENKLVIQLRKMAKGCRAHQQVP